jgi:DNA end-binding protein Ku
MPARPAWRGQIRLSLVTILVEMYPAQTEARTRLRTIHKPTMKPVQNAKVVEGIGPVDADEIVRGYQYDKGQYVLLEDDELDAIKLETKKTLDLVQFCDLCEINPLFFDKAYYVVPADELAEDAFRVIRDALADSGRVGLGQMAVRGHEYLVALQASGRGMLANTLHYEEEVRQAEEIYRGSGVKSDPAEPQLVDIAAQVIERAVAPFNPEAYRDSYEEGMRALVAKKVKLLPKPVKGAPEPNFVGAAPTGNVIDLMASLKRSLEAPQPLASKPVRKKAAAASAATKPSRVTRKAG